MGVGDRKRCVGCDPRCCGVCAGCSVAVGVLLLLVGIWATVLRSRLTPVYRDIVCQLEPAKVDGVWFDSPLTKGGLHLKLVTLTTCSNPNPYDVTVSSSRSGQVYMGDQNTPAGSVENIPPATLPARGSGSIQADVLVTPTPEVLGSLLDFLISRQIPIYLENNLAVDVNAKFFFGSFATSRTFNKDCGMMLKLMPNLKGVVGPMACADDWKTLQVPDFQPSETTPNELVFTADRIAGDEIEKATKLKDVATGITMGIGYGLGALFLLSGSVGLAWFCARRRRAAPVKVDESNVQAEEPPADVAASPHLVQEV